MFIFLISSSVCFVKENILRLNIDIFKWSILIHVSPLSVVF